MRGCQDHHDRADPSCHECARYEPPLTVAALRSRVAALEAALRLATEWGIKSNGHDGTMAVALRKWVDGGMRGAPPQEEHWLRDMRETMSRMSNR